MREADKRLKYIQTKPSDDPASTPSNQKGVENTANPAFLNARERRAMLEDIGHVALALARSLPIGHLGMKPSEKVTASPFPARPDALTSPLERLHYLGELWTRLSGALGDITRQPDSRMTTTQRQISLARSRGGATAATLVTRSPVAATAWHSLQAAHSHALRFDLSASPAQSSSPRVPRNFALPASDAGEGLNAGSANTNSLTWERALIAEPAFARSENTWANRMVVSLVRDMAQEAQALARLADFCDDEAAAVQATQIADAGRRLLAGTWLRGCPALRDGEQHASFAADLIARCAPAYGVVYGGWRALHHPLDFDWTHAPMLALPSLEAWHLYEIWCCLQVGAALERAGWRLDAVDARAAGAPTPSLLRCTPQGLRLNMATGRASRLLFRKMRGCDTKPGQRSGRGQQGGRGQRSEHEHDAEWLCLYYQPLFSSADQTASRQEGRQASRPTASATFQKPHLEAAQYAVQDASARADASFDVSSFSDVSDVSSDSPAASEDSLTLAFESRSHAMQPDIALYRRGALTLLDPKYRRYAQPEDAQNDINKMHAYRDAITARPTRGHKGAARPNVVTAAWCLFPGVGAQDVDAQSTQPDTQPDMRSGTQPREKKGEEHDSKQEKKIHAYPAPSAEHPLGTAQVGAFLLRPGQPDTLPRLAAFLTTLLDASP